MNKYDFSVKTMDSLISDLASVCLFIGGNDKHTVICRLEKEIEDGWKEAKVFRDKLVIPLKNYLKEESKTPAYQGVYSVGKIHLSFNSLLVMYCSLQRRRGREILIESYFFVANEGGNKFSIQEAFDFSEGSYDYSIRKTVRDIYDKYLKQHRDLLVLLDRACSSCAIEMNRLLMEAYGTKPIDDPEDYFPIISNHIDESLDCYWSNEIRMRMDNILSSERRVKCPLILTNDIFDIIDYLAITVGGFMLYRPINNFRRIYTHKTADGTSMESIIKERCEPKIFSFLDEFISVWK